MYAAVSAACKSSELARQGFVDVWLGTAYQIIQLDGVDALVDTGNDLHGDGGSIDMVGVKAVTQSRHASCDFVELNTLLASVCSFVRFSNQAANMQCHLPRLYTNMVARSRDCK